MIVINPISQGEKCEKSHLLRCGEKYFSYRKVIQTIDMGLVKWYYRVMARLKKNTRPPRFRGPAEKDFYDRCVAAGWGVSKRGFPAFMCWKGQELVLVDVKTSDNHRRKPEVRRFMDYLAKRGIKTYKWFPGCDWNPN